MLAELLEHLAVARADDAVRVLVVSSADHMGLSAGADVKEELDEEGKVRRMQLFADLYDAIVGFPKPTIAACHGDVVGGGAEIAIACDMRVGGSNLRMRFPGAALGVPVGPARLVTLCGLAAAKYLLLSSRTVGADEALRLGLVNRVAPAAATEEAALELAAAVAAHPPEAVARLKRMLHEWDDVEGRSQAEGEGQVEWQRGPGPGLPFAESTSSAPAPRDRRSRTSASTRSPAACATPPAAARRSTVRASAMLRPLLLAALLEDDRGLAGRPALLVSADDRSARDLAADLRAYLAPRRVRFYPSRGTGYASHVTPPPHLVGLRIDALDALARRGGRGRRRQRHRARRGRPRRLAAPGRLRDLARARRSSSARVADDLVAAGYERVEQVEERGQFAVRGGILDVFPATEERAVRIELFGDEVESMRWFSTFTQRSLGEAERVELAPAAELDAEHRELAELAAMEAAEEGERAAEPRRGAAARALRRAARPGPRRGRRRSSPPPRRSSRRCATTGRTRRRRCTPTTPATSTSTSPRRWPSAPRSR